MLKYGYELPPYFYPPTPVGAHITLVSSEEAGLHGVDRELIEDGK